MGISPPFYEIHGYAVDFFFVHDFFYLVLLFGCGAVVLRRLRRLTLGGGVVTWGVHFYNWKSFEKNVRFCILFVCANVVDKIFKCSRSWRAMKTRVTSFDAKLFSQKDRHHASFTTRRLLAENNEKHHKILKTERFQVHTLVDFKPLFVFYFRSDYTSARPWVVSLCEK